MALQEIMIIRVSDAVETVMIRVELSRCNEVKNLTAVHEILL
jgi:hypothetical protein